jgi:putative ABC transport system permease protein
MLYSYLTIAFRNFIKRKVFSLINIFGLSIGFSVCLILLSFVAFELSYDRHNEKANQIYRTVSSFYIKGELRGTYPLSDFGQGPALLATIPEVNSFVRTHLMHGALSLVILTTYQNASSSMKTGTYNMLIPTISTCLPTRPLRAIFKRH